MIGYIIGGLVLAVTGFVIYGANTKSSLPTSQPPPNPSTPKPGNGITPVKATIPTAPGTSRETAILEHVRAGNATYNFTEIVAEIPGHRAVFKVFADALMIEGIRVNVTAATNQAIADALGCVMLTPRIADLMWKQKQTALPPFPAPPFPMDSLDAMIWHSKKIDTALASKIKPYGLICTVGKLWVLSNKLVDAKGFPFMKFGAPIAMNYGWHFEGDKFEGRGFEAISSKDFSGRLIQGEGTAHNCLHSDYSQVCVLMHANCLVDDKPMKVVDVWKDPSLSGLATLGGVLRVVRQPSNADSRYA